MSGLVIISLISSSPCLTAERSTSNAKGILDQRIKENSLQLRNAIRLTIYEYCFTEWFQRASNGQDDTISLTQWTLCLANGLTVAKQKFGIKMEMIEE